jgi:hypothetical protein
MLVVSIAMVKGGFVPVVRLGFEEMLSLSLSLSLSLYGYAVSFFSGILELLVHGDAAIEGISRFKLFSLYRTGKDHEQSIALMRS